MRKLHIIAPLGIAAILGVSGCVTVPTGPSVMALPGTQKPFDVFRADDADCRNFAYAQIGGQEGQQAATNSAAASAAVGTLVGAAIGAAIGGPSGQAGQGAAIGAGSGLLVGSAAGSNAYGASSYTMQRRYDNAYVQCMYAKGNQVPVAAGVRQYGPPQSAYAPPPQYYPPPASSSYPSAPPPSSYPSSPPPPVRAY